MDEVRIRVFNIDGDSCKVIFRYDPESGIYFGDYPDFEETPRRTPGGRPWVAAMQDACNFGVNEFVRHDPCMDCGSCGFFRKEHPGDLIGVCDNDQNRERTGSTDERRKDEIE